MSIDQDATGRRVVVRMAVGGRGPSGGPAMTDVVGRLVGLTADEARIERRDGSLATVALSDVVTWKVVPDRPRRTRPAMSFSADELTPIASRGWPAVIRAHVGDWELRASGGFTGRANSVAVHGDPGLPFEDALAVVDEFYVAHGAPAMAQVVVGSAQERAFEAAGWQPIEGYRGGAVVQVADLTGTYRPDPEVTVSTKLDDDWMTLYGRVDENPEAARAVLTGPETVAFVSLGDPLVAIGRVVVTGAWTGVAAVEVVPERRREGLGRRIVSTALAWAFDRGADKAYLQTMRENTAALALYAPFGFVDHHDYRYVSPWASCRR